MTHPRAVSHIIAFIFALLLTACGKFEVNPYSVDIPGHIPSDLNNKAIAQIKTQEETADDTITILFTGDSQRFYDELENLVSRVNALDGIDFLVLAGDISDFGLAREFEWIYERLSRLEIPYLCVIGNHDLTARGREVYQRLFGAINFSFDYKNHRFIFHDTNGLEYGFNGSVPNIPWLRQQVNESPSDFKIGVSHVPPYAKDFDPLLTDAYREVLSADTGYVLSLHGHLHSTNDLYHYGNHVRFINSNAVQAGEAILLKIHNGRTIQSIIHY